MYIRQSAVRQPVARRAAAVSLLFCGAGAAGNIIFPLLNGASLGLPLYIDTLFTIAVTLSRGLVPGLLTGILTNLAAHSLFFNGWLAYLYTLCNMATALVTFLFIPLFPDKEDSSLQAVIDRLIVLVLLSFTLCIVISFMGGSIAAAIKFFFPQDPSSNYGPEILFKLALRRRRLPLLAVEILSRVPINIIDRLVSVFGAAGIAALAGRLKAPG